jgi:hypothetical protein
MHVLVGKAVFFLKHTVMKGKQHLAGTRVVVPNQRMEQVRGYFAWYSSLHLHMYAHGAADSDA